MPPDNPGQLLRRLVVGDEAAIAAIVDASRTSEDPLILVAAALFAPDADGFLARAGRIAATTRDRQLVAIATAHRQLTAEIVGTVGAGADAVEAWSRSRGAALDQARATLEAVTASGLTVSKATVAASLLADLARPKGGAIAS